MSSLNSLLHGGKPSAVLHLFAMAMPLLRVSCSRIAQTWGSPFPVWGNMLMSPFFCSCFSVFSNFPRWDLG